MNIIQIGCNDGNDPVFSFISERKKDIKKCVLIDANPTALEAAKERYKPLSDLCEFRNLAVLPIDTNNYEIEMFCPVKDPVSGFTSVSREHVVAHAHSRDLLSIKSPTISLSSLLSEHPETNHLFIDTEGLDALNLLSVNFSITRIRHLVFEYIHTDGIVKQGPRLKSLLLYLSEFGFRTERDPSCKYNIVAKR